MKRFLSLAAAVALLVCLTACAVGSDTYTLFAYDMDGYVQEALAINSEMKLKENGTGRMTINGDSGSIRWSVDDGVFTLVSGDDTMTGTIGDGVIRLSVLDAVWYYATEDADTSSIHVLTQEEYYRTVMGK